MIAVFSTERVNHNVYKSIHAYQQITCSTPTVLDTYYIYIHYATIRTYQQQALRIRTCAA